MSYAETLLSNGERVTLRSRQHWLAIFIDARKGFLALVGAAVLFVLSRGLTESGLVRNLYDLLSWITLGLLVVGIARIALTIANWMNEEYIVTNRRVMKVSGLINKHSADSSLEKINDAVLDQNMFGRMFNYGDLDIVTAAEEAVDKYRMLQGVITFKKEILNQKHDLEFETMRPPVSPPLRASAPVPASTAALPASGAPMTMGGDSSHPLPDDSRPAAPARTMSADDITRTLAGLADLRDRGAISPEEFEGKKADLLARL